MTGLPPLRYLGGADVTAAMPPLPERLALAEQTLLGLAGAAELPPKIGVHPEPDESFAHAMPAYLPGDGAADRLGMKWVLGFNTNNALGLPAIHGILLLNDPQTGVPTGILDAGPITAQRTAAISGVAIRAWAPSVAGRAPRATLIGAGVQGGSHVPVLGHVLPGVELSIFDTDPDRAGRLAATARETPGIRAAEVAASARDAVDGADVVVSAAAFLPPSQRQSLTNAWLAPGALIVPIDYATYCAAEVARDAALFVVDHREQFLANRDAGQFDGYPDPTTTMGEALASDRPRPDGRVVATHLGTGLADVVFGTAILEAAAAMGLGTELPPLSPVLDALGLMAAGTIALLPDVLRWQTAADDPAEEMHVTFAGVARVVAGIAGTFLGAALGISLALGMTTTPLIGLIALGAVLGGFAGANGGVWLARQLTNRGTSASD